MKRVYIITVILLLAEIVTAQTEQELLPAERKQLTIITEPFTLYKGFFRPGITMHYGSFYKVFDNDGSRELISNASGRQWISELSLKYGISDRLEVTAALAYKSTDWNLSFKGESPGTNEFVQVKTLQKGSGIGDLYIDLAYQIFTETISRPSIKVIVRGSIPTGEKNPVDTGDPNVRDLPVGLGYYSVYTGILLRKISYPFSYTADIGYTLNLEGSKQFWVGGPETSFNEGEMISVSGGFNFHMNEWLALVNEVNYFNAFTDEVEGQPVDESNSWLVQYTPRLSFQIKRLRVNQGISIPLFGKTASADPRFFLVVQYMF